MINDDILAIVQKASLKIENNKEILVIRHKLRIGDKSIWGIFFFLLGGAFMIIAPFIKTADNFSKIVGVIIGVLFIGLSILTMIRQVADGVKVTNNAISFRYKLKQVTIPWNRISEIKMKSEVMRISRVGTTGSDFIIVTNYLVDMKQEIPVLQFQMDNSDADAAIKLGIEVVRIIREKKVPDVIID